jgi:protein-S-isoprenylcysteine O-methyltransferase Ste14
LSLVVIVSFLWIASEVVIARTRVSQGSDKSKDKSTLRILWITITVSITAGIYLRRFGYGEIDSLAELFYYAGIVFILIGLIVRWMAISKLKHFFTVNVSIQEDHRLIRGGLYKHVRHPAYLGSLTSFFGLGLSFHNGLTLVVIFVPILFAFIHRISIEEEVLIEEFGEEYRNYSKMTSRLFPGIY